MWHSTIHIRYQSLILLHKLVVLFLIFLACVAGVRKGRGRELGRETTREGGGREGNFLARPSRFSRA